MRVTFLDTAWEFPAFRSPHEKKGIKVKEKKLEIDSEYGGIVNFINRWITSSFLQFCPHGGAARWSG